MSKWKSTMVTMFLLVGFLMISMYLLPVEKAYAAAGPVRVYAVEYYDENIIVLNNQNTKIYFATDSDAANGNWDVISVDSTSKYTAIDFSWLQASSDNVILIKGDADTTQSRVVIKEKPGKLSLTIDYSNLDSLSSTATIGSIVNIMSNAGTGEDPITFDDLEWRKGENGQWMSTKKLTKSIMENYLVKGVYLNFRIRAVDDTVSFYLSGTLTDLNNNRINGITGGIRYYEGNTSATYGSDYPDGTDGRRFSDAIKVKVVKKSATAVTGVDGEKLTTALKYGKEYRVTITSGSTTYGGTSWTKIIDKTVKNLSLVTIANSTTGNVFGYDGITNTKSLPAMKIEVRDYATSKAASSKITEINLDAQRTLSKTVQSGVPNTAVTQTTDDVYVSYVGNKALLLTIPLAASDLPYEYCVVKSGATLDLSTAVWTSVTKGTGIKILADKAVDGGTLYIRQKEIKYKAATKTTSAIAYKLASTCVSFDIDYPSVPVVTKDTLTYVKGYTTTPLTITVQLNASGKDPYETTVQSIKLGTKSIGFTPSTVTSGGISTLTLTLTSADIGALTNCTSRAVTITFLNGTVDKTSIKLTIKSPTTSGTLSMSASKGSATGNTKITVIDTIGTGNSWVYVISDAAVTGKYVEDVLASGTGTAFTSGSDIAVTANKYITVYEINSTRNIIKYKSIQITSDMIQ